MANSYASLGLQQDEQGQFSPIAGFGIGAMPSAEEISKMSWKDRMGMMTSQMGQSQHMAQQANLGLLSAQLNEVDRLGVAGRQQITDVFSQERGRASQSLAARGLGSTTVGSAMSAGLAGREARARTGLEERLAGQRLNVLNAASFQQPDMGGFYNQMMQAGAAGLGQKPPKQQEWWKGPALGAGLDWLTKSSGGSGGGGMGGGGGQSNLSKIIGGIGGMFKGGGGEGDLSSHPAYASGTGLFGQPVGGEAAGYVTRFQSPGGAGSGFDAGYATATDQGGLASKFGGLATSARSGASLIGGKLAGLGTAAKGAALGLGKGAMTLGSTLLASPAAPVAAAAIGAYLVYRNNKEKIDNLYDDAEEDVKRFSKRQMKSLKKTLRDPGRLFKKHKKKAKKLWDKIF